MKFVSKYNLKKSAIILSIATLGFAGCEKEPVMPVQSEKVPTAEFWYTVDLNFYRPSTPENLIPASAFVDTVAQISTNDSIKKIHINPYASRMFQNNNNMESVAGIFENMYDKSNNKLSGDKTTLVLTNNMYNNQKVGEVLRDKLAINITRQRQ